MAMAVLLSYTSTWHKPHAAHLEIPVLSVWYIERIFYMFFELAMFDCCVQIKKM